MNELYQKNEFETNEFVVKTIQFLLIFVFIIGALCWLHIFAIDCHMINGFICASILPLLLPTLLVNVMHLDKKWVKYCLISCVIIMTGISYVVFTFQTVLIFIVPSILATFYLDKKVMWFAFSATIINILISHLITVFYLFQPWIEPFLGLKAIMLYGAFPRILQYMCCMVFLSVLCKRYATFLNSFHSVLKEETKNQTPKEELDARLECLTERERDVFELLVTGHTNAQIANQLFLSNGTVKNYVSVIYDKMGERDRTVLVLKYSPYYRTYDHSHI